MQTQFVGVYDMLTTFRTKLGDLERLVVLEDSTSHATQSSADLLAPPGTGIGQSPVSLSPRSRTYQKDVKKLKRRSWNLKP
jgi:Tfp pilus assembly protein PilO